MVTSLYITRLVYAAPKPLTQKLFVHSYTLHPHLSLWGGRDYQPHISSKHLLVTTSLEYRCRAPGCCYLSYQGWPTTLLFEAVSYLSGFLNFSTASIDTDKSLQKLYRYNFSHILWQLMCKYSSYFYLSRFPDVYVLQHQALFSEKTSLLLLTSYPTQLKSYILLSVYVLLFISGIATHSLCQDS